MPDTTQTSEAQVVWDSVRVLASSGETVSITGTHLGHNLPDRKGNRYCINIASVAAKPPDSAATGEQSEELRR